MFQSKSNVNFSVLNDFIFCFELLYNIINFMMTKIKIRKIQIRRSERVLCVFGFLFSSFFIFSYIRDMNTVLNDKLFFLFKKKKKTH